MILTIAAVCLPLLVIAGFVVVEAANDEVESEIAATEASTETLATDPVAGEFVPFGPQGPNEFPDFGSDFMGDELPLLTRRTNDAGISMTVQKLDWGAFRGGGVFMEEAVDISVAVAGVAVPDTVGSVPTTAAAVPDATTAVGPTTAADAADGPPRVNAAPSPQTSTPVPMPVPAPLPPKAVPGPAGDGANGWQPAGWCSSTSGFRVTMGDGDSIGTSQGQMYDDVRDDVMPPFSRAGMPKESRSGCSSFKCRRA